ncbi:MAG: hypothetical protein IIY87_05910 [Bacteroidales bacterium]|nr:hypothetical protein [Bacteroidales bacterium]
MTNGKNICNQLKAVRKGIAEENGIPLEIEECTYKGECRGTCPRCEAEVRYLENALAERMKLGKVATIAGLALGLAASAQAQEPCRRGIQIPDTSSTRDSVVTIERMPLPQNTDVEAYKLQEEMYGTARGEDGSVVTYGTFRRRMVNEPPKIQTQAPLQKKFIENNGTPSSQALSQEQEKMYEEKTEIKQ